MLTGTQRMAPAVYGRRHPRQQERDGPGSSRTHQLDLVIGLSVHRHEGRLRRLGSRIADALRRSVNRGGVRGIGCSTRGARRETLVRNHFFDGMHRFMPTLVRMQLLKTEELPVNHRPCLGGRSACGIARHTWVGAAICQGCAGRSPGSGAADLRPLTAQQG
jgi:hypothetical protein